MEKRESYLSLIPEGTIDPGLLGSAKALEEKGTELPLTSAIATHLFNKGARGSSELYLDVVSRKIALANQKKTG